jgi:hypothetical protein
MKKLIAMVVTLAMLTMMPTVAFAAAPAPDAVITGGTLAITELAIADFTPVTLDGTTQTTTAVVTPTSLTDSTGSGDGWQVSLKASVFTLAAADLLLAAVGAVGTLPLSSLELGIVSIVTVDVGSTPITNIVKATQGKIDTVAGVNILSAPLTEGMGTYTVSMAPMTLTLLPASTYAGTYTSTVTETLTTGPVV